MEDSERVRIRLKEGRPLADVHWDALVNPAFRKQSEQHFTPVEVAMRAAHLLTSNGATRILDVGSGVGKFCLVGALSTPAHFVGVERRASLVVEANRLKALLGAERAQFFEGDALDADWTTFDGVYLFNPFLEHLVFAIRMDDSVPFSESEFDKSLRRVQAHLRNAPIGMNVALFHGMGGGVPVGYRRLFKETMGTGQLEIWKKRENP